MGITDDENRLFEKWKKDRNKFVADGVVDETAYNESDIKILFILKEVNSEDGGWDLREYLRDRNERTQTWNNITRWVIGIRNLNENLCWKGSEIEEIPTEKRIQTLRSICAINLKKSPGGHTTDEKKLADVAKNDREYLNEQLSLYDPDLTICCGTIVKNLFHELVRFEKPIDWRSTTRGIDYHEYKRDKYVISYSHPEARVQDNLLYYGLLDAIREIYRVF